MSAQGKDYVVKRAEHDIIIRTNYGTQLSALEAGPSDIVFQVDRSQCPAAELLPIIPQKIDCTSESTTRNVTAFADIFLRVAKQMTEGLH